MERIQEKTIKKSEKMKKLKVGTKRGNGKKERYSKKHVKG